MQINSYNRSQLKDFIDSDFYAKSERVPISRHRALSHIHNPDCSEDDILLWAAYKNDLLIGYVGILPGVSVACDKEEKIYWLSCFWVDESYRKENIASLLFFPLVKRYKERLFISNFIPTLEKTYQSLGVFQPTFFRAGERFYLRSCLANIVPVRFPKTKFLKPFLKLTDGIFNLLFSVKSLFYKKAKKEYECVENSCFDEEFQLLIDSSRVGGSYIRRDAKHFDWILKYPWILPGKPDKESERYFFSSKSEHFGYTSLKIYEKENLRGYVLLKIRDKSLTVSYLYADRRVIKDIAAYIFEKANEENLEMITTFDDRLANEIKRNRIRYLFSRKIARPYILTKKTEIQPAHFQEGDGDNVFT